MGGNIGGDSISVDDKIGKNLVESFSVCCWFSSWTDVTGWKSDNSEISAEKPSLAK